MTTIAAVPVTADAYQLAEGPVWDADRERILWVDIPAGRVHEGILVDGAVITTGQHDFPATVGAVVPARDGSLLVPAHDQLISVGASGRRVLGAPLLPAGQRSRFNDGGCDP